MLFAIGMKVLGWFSASSVQGLAQLASNYFTAKANSDLQRDVTRVSADAQVNVAYITAQIEQQKQIAMMANADRGSLWTCWMKPTAFALCMVHFGAIVFDSVPLFGHVIGSWQIPPLPGMYADIEKWTILTIVGVVGIKSIGRIWAPKS